jgi:phage baseplate assembly protein W
MPLRVEKTEHLRRDLAIEAVHRELRPVYTVLDPKTPAPNGRGRIWDLVPRAGKENLAQAVIMRLLTPRGELAALGHPEYGSRIHELIGSENTGTQRNLLKLYVLEALQFEPRVAKVAELNVIPTPGTRSTVDVLLKVQVAGAAELVQIGPFSIELAV